MELHFVVDGNEFSRAGEASGEIKKTLKRIGVSPETIRKVAIAAYEAEINMVIHANGGVIDADITSESVCIVFKDNGPGIPDIDAAMREGFSTASDEARDLGFGAGMGLPNIKKNSDALKVSSVLGEGTTVELTVNF